MHGVFHDNSGNRSSKRIFGIGCFIMACITAIIALIYNRDGTIPGAFLAASTAVFVTQAITKT